MNARVVGLLVAVMLLAGGGLWVKRTLDAARPKGSDDAQIRQMLFDGEAAAERREPTGVSKFLSEDYRDGLGLSDSSMRFQIGRYLREHKEISLNIPSQSIQIQLDPEGRTGSVSFTLEAGVGEGTGATTVPMTLKLKKDPVRYLWLFPGEEWRVTSAEGYQGVPD